MGGRERNRVPSIGSLTQMPVTVSTWQELEPGAKNTIQVSPMSGKDQSLELSLLLSSVKSEVLETESWNLYLLNRQRENKFSSAASFFNQKQHSGLGQGQSQEHDPRSPMLWAGTQLLGPSLLTSRICINRKLEVSIKIRHSDTGCLYLNH